MDSRTCSLFARQTPEEARQEHKAWEYAAHEAYGFLRTLVHELRELVLDVWPRRRT